MTETIRQRRFRALMATFQEEHGYGWQSALAKKVGVTQGLISHIVNDKKSPGPDCIEGAIERMRVSEDFFRDASLGEKPDYRRFVGKSRYAVDASPSKHALKPTPSKHASFAGEPRIGRDPIDESSMDQWTVFTYTDEYKGASEEAKAHAHTLRNQGLDLSVKQYIGVVESLDALRKGKGIPEHKIETPIGETRMRLGPGKKGR